MKQLLTGLICLISLSITGQEISRITGIVVSAESNQGIPNASVFVSGTTIGTVTDTSGRFVLTGLPFGTFELVISSIGYQTLVQQYSAGQLPLNIRAILNDKTTDLQAVTVEPFDKDGWKNWGKFFLESFIGTSKAADQCRILNTDVLRFRYSRKTGMLTVVATEPLKIENKALGYTIQYQLEEFQYSNRQHTLFYLGYPLFQDMASDRKKIPGRWQKARKNAYDGSMTHFMRSLYNNRLQEEGFEVRRLVKKENTEKARVKQIRQSDARKNISSGGVVVMRLGDNIPRDTLDYYGRVMRQPDFIDMLYPDLLGADSLLTDNKDSSRLLFFPDYLHIVYKKGMEEQEYLDFIHERRKAFFQSSRVFLLADSPILIEPSGMYYPPQEVMSEGYWAWSEKIAHLLPIGYDPTE